MRTVSTEPFPSAQLRCNSPFSLYPALYHRPDSGSALLCAFSATDRCKYQAERCKKYKKSSGNSFEHKNTHPVNTILPDSSLLYHSFLFFASTDLPSAVSVAARLYFRPLHHREGTPAFLRGALNTYGMITRKLMKKRRADSLQQRNSKHNRNFMQRNLKLPRTTRSPSKFTRKNSGR